MSSGRRHAMAEVPADSPQVLAMTDKLQNVSLADLKSQMVDANVPGAKEIAWKVDLITLAVEHNFVYKFGRGLVLLPQSGGGAGRGLVLLSPSTPQSGGAGRPSSAQVHPTSGSTAFAAIPSSTQHAAPPVVCSPPAASSCVSDSLQKLYEAEWTQTFDAPIDRGYVFPGTHTSQEIQAVIKGIGHDGGCCFHKTDEYSKIVPVPQPDNWTDGWDVTIRFECPHRQQSGKYIPKKGRKTEYDSSDVWRNMPRDSFHVTGTSCKAGFSINGKLQDDSKFMWRVTPKMRANFSMKHTGHPPPYAKYLQNMILSVQEKVSIQELVESGANSTQISNFLSDNGKKGAISKQTIQFIANDIDEVEQKVGSLRLREPGVSDAEALIQNLQALPNCKVVYLVKEVASRDNILTSVINSEAHQFSVTPSDMDDATELAAERSPDQQPSIFRVGLSAIVATLRGWANVQQPAVIQGGSSTKPPASVSANGGREDCSRIVTVNGKSCLLLALLWAFTEEVTMFAKYPEILHHDTKGRVCKWGMPWWYSVGVNGARGNFIALRGWIHNESRAMFRFCEKALTQIHGDSLKKLICHCSDGDDDLIAVLNSMSQAGGCSPKAICIRCMWHIIDRGILHEFRTLAEPWIVELIGTLWRLCFCMETPAEFQSVWHWLTGTWMRKVQGKSTGSAPRLPSADRCSSMHAALLPAFLDRVYVTRSCWCLAWKLTLPAMDTAVNSRVEIENGVLSRWAGCSGRINAGKLAENEGRNSLTAYKREGRVYFSRLNKELTTAPLIPRNTCKNLMTSIAYDLLSEQVSVAQHCLLQGEASIELCKESMDDCDVCKQYMLPHQGGKRNGSVHPAWFPNAIHNNTAARFHVTISMEATDLPPKNHSRQVGADPKSATETLYASCPWPGKRTRIVSLHEHLGKVWLLCSCGFDMRQMMACRHCSVLLGALTDSASWGEEACSIFIRNLISFAYWNNLSDLPARDAYDFIGTATECVSLAQLAQFVAVRASIDNSTVAVELQEGGEDNLRMTPAKHSMRSMREEMKVPFNKLTNSIFKAMTSATTISQLQANSKLGMSALREIMKLFPESSASTGETTKRYKPIGEATKPAKLRKTNKN